MMALSETLLSKLCPESRRLFARGFTLFDLHSKVTDPNRGSEKWVQSFKRVYPDIWDLYLGRDEKGRTTI